MARWLSVASAWQHPSWMFGLSGGLFALLFTALPFLSHLGDGSVHYTLTTTGALFILGGFCGGAVVCRLLWTRLDATKSPLRGTLVGALIGLLALPIPFYLAEFAAVPLAGNPFEAQLGPVTWMQVLMYVFLLLVTPLALGAFGIIVTRGGTILVGATTGYLLTRR